MVYFVIAGKSDCINYHHACNVGTYLSERLPDFHIIKQEYNKEEYKTFLEEQNTKYKWYHTKSPLIWKEFVSGGKPYLIGFLSEFWEYCYDYYALESKLPKQELENIVNEHLKVLDELSEVEGRSPRKVRNICVSGAANPMMIKLLPELIDLRELECEEGVCIRLYDRYCDVPENLEFIRAMIDDLDDYVYEGPKRTVELVTSLGQGLKNCDLFIIIDYFRQKTYKNVHNMLQRKMSVMMHYADILNAHAERHLRVILSQQGPLCFSAAVLTTICTRVRLQNIVAVTADLGLSTVRAAAEKTNVEVASLGAAPVWGFIGLNQMVDVEHIVRKAEMFIPYERAVRCDKTSTLPLGTVRTELRYLGYLGKDEDEVVKLAHRRKIKAYERLRMLPFTAKVRATVQLLKLWYTKKERDDIISLGVRSDGTFGIPAGTVFSQPVMLDRRKFWMPCKEFPINKKTEEKIQHLVIPVVKLMNDYNVGRKYSGSSDYEKD